MAFCVAVTVVGVLIQLPGVLRDAHRDARKYVGLSYADREVGGGNSVVVDQTAVYVFRALIPKDETFEVLVGEPQPDWSNLTQTSTLDWFRADLVPRRIEAGAPWVICYACDRAAVGEATVMWEGRGGISLLRRT